MGYTVITPEIESYVEANYLELSGREIALKFGVSKCAIERYMRNNNYCKSKEQIIEMRRKKVAGRTSLTKEQDVFIQENYLTMNVNRIAIHINRSETIVRGRLRQLGLAIPKEIIEQRKLDSRIKPGNVPSNKGKKQHEYMSPEAIEKTKATRYGKGHKPKNTLHDGAIVIRHNHKDREERPYQWIRISEGNWMMLHVYNWIKVNGPIPEGMIIVFKSPDTMNCDVGNLEMISRQENMNRNTIQNYSPDIKSTIRLISKLNKTISNVQKQKHQ